MQEYDADLDELVESHRSNRSAGKGSRSGNGEARRRRLRRIVAGVLIALAMVAGASFAYVYLSAPSTLAATLPDEVGGFPVTNVLSGADALKSTETLHIGKLGRPVNAVIASYGPTVSVWLMAYPSDSLAREAVRKMALKMRKVGKGFQKIKTVKRGGVEVRVTRPDDKPQYFWAYGRVVGYIVPGEMPQPQSFRAIDAIDRSLFYYYLWR